MDRTLLQSHQGRAESVCHRDRVAGRRRRKLSLDGDLIAAFLQTVNLPILGSAFVTRQTEPKAIHQKPLPTAEIVVSDLDERRVRGD